MTAPVGAMEDRRRGDMLIAEDLLLLLTDDRTGKLLVPSRQADLALAGAVLIELAAAQRVGIAGEGGSVRPGRLVVADASPTSDDLLDDALAELVAKQGRKPKDVLPRLARGLRGRLYSRLVEAGVLRDDAAKVLAVVPVHRRPTVDPSHEEGVRLQLAGALRSGTTDDVRAGSLIALLHALEAVAKVVDPADVGIARKELNANAERIAEGNWGSQAVRDAIDALLAAVIAANSTVVASGA